MDFEVFDERDLFNVLAHTFMTIGTVSNLREKKGKTVQKAINKERERERERARES